MESDIVTKQTELDDVLIKFSAFSRYNLKIFSLMSLAFMSNAIYCSNYVFTVQRVEYWCEDPSFDSIQCQATNSSKFCSKWIYKNPDSFVGEYGLACSDWKRTLVGSAHSFGYMIGLLLVGPLSDKLGRKPVFIVLAVTGGFFGLARSLISSYWLYVVFEILEAAIGDSFSPIYMLAIEATPTKHRVKFMTLLNCFFGCGGMTLATAAYLFPYYRTLLRVIYTPAIIFLLYIYFLYESPRWLLTKGKKKEAITIIERMAKTNKIKLDTGLLDDLPDKMDEEDVCFRELIKITFASKTLLTRCVICIIWFNACSFIAYGITINSVEFQGNKYINYALTSLVDIPTNYITYLILEKCKRKISLIMSFLIGAVMCLALPFIPKGLYWLSLVVFLGGKIMSTIYFSITYLYTSELFPTYTRNSMHALCSSLGRIGSMVAPQTPLLMVYWHGLPSILFGLTALVAGLATFFVPDTDENPLPNNVKQAETINYTPKIKDAQNA